MIDRNVEFPNRFRMTKVEGTDDIYDIIPAPGEVIAPGDTFSKANMLPDSIPALLGLKMANPQVKDALNVLANVGNLHVWERVQTYSEPVPEVPAGYTFGSEQSVVAVGTSDGSSYYCTIYYADSVTVSSDGVVSLSNPSNQRNRIYDWIGSSTLAGKFCIMGEYDGSTNLVKPTENGGVVFYVPSGGTIAYNESTKQITISKYQSVTGYPYTPAIPAGTTTDYLTSTDPNAYPKQSAEGGQDAYYTLGDVVSGATIATLITNSTVSFTVKKSDSVNVSENGVVSLPSTATENTVSLNNDSDKDSIFSNYKGCFIQLVGNSNVTVNIGDVIWIPSDAVFSGLNPITVSKYQPVTGHAAIPANTTITITYLGQLGGGARIEVGSYVGTGTYGKTNPNSLTFGFEPKLVLIRGVKPARGAALLIHGVEGSYIYWGYNTGSSYRQIVCTWNGKNLSFYANNSDCYCNVQSDKYLYIAIG